MDDTRLLLDDLARRCEERSSCEERSRVKRGAEWRLGKGRGKEGEERIGNEEEEDEDGDDDGDDGDDDDINDAVTSQVAS